MKILIKGFVHVINIRYLFKYGSDVPVYQERIRVNPQDIRLRLIKKTTLTKVIKLRRFNGCVVEGDWDQFAINNYGRKDEAIAERYNKGKSWQETVLFKDKMKCIGYESEKMYKRLKERYKKLDEIYEEIKKAGALSSMDQHLVTLCLGRNGELIHVGQGVHRIAIAKILEIPSITAKLGFVHPDGIQHLVKYRTPQTRSKSLSHVALDSFQ